jgi:hypothetical protein
MDEQLERIEAQMAKLAQQKKKIKEKSAIAISNLITKSKSDISVLAGILLDAENIIQKNGEKVEAWRDTGKNFLKKGKHSNIVSKDRTSSKSNNSM